MENTFKLIAVRPLKECKPYILKNLQKEVNYYFSTDYIISEDGKTIRKVGNSNLNPLSSEFFQITGADGPQVNISAIVGKNGDGKSSIVELAIRLLNNFAKAFNFGGDCINLCHIDGVAGILYYECGGNLFSIKESPGNENSTGPEIRLYKNGKQIWYSRGKKEDIDWRKFRSEHFFFTILTNYSLYAYNSNDFQDETQCTEFESAEGESRCWLGSVFHKNDGYQTPLVLHPYRDKGNTDINTENYLTRQRLISLFTVEDSYDAKEEHQTFRHINNGQFAQYLLLKEAAFSKLTAYTLQRYFKETKNSSRLDVVIQNAKDILDEVKDSKRKIKGITKPILQNLEISYLQPLEEIYRFINRNKNKFLFCKQFVESSKSDLTELIDILEEIGKYVDHQSLDVRDLVDKFRTHQMNRYNIAQIQRLQLIEDVIQIWGTEGPSGIDWSRLNYWSEFNIKDYYNNCLQYIVYKTIQVFKKYPEYDNAIFGYDHINLIFDKKYQVEETRNRLKRAFALLLQDMESKSHITLKMSQTVHFLENVEFYNEPDSRTRENGFIKFDPEKIADATRYRYILDFSEYRIYLNKQKLSDADRLDLSFLPPPIFETDIRIRQSNGDCTSLNFLSSGEKQKLYSVSSIIYHLKNLDSISGDKYQNVNLLFEEIELYFHPEYQRQYIKFMLEQIGKAKLNEVKRINMLFVTHSPFILSDIPKQNVLFLKNGLPTYKMQENTFGANIHSLLKNGFFLDTVPIGAFAKEKINRMFDKLNSGNFNDEEYKQLYDDILLVGEPYIRSQLLGLYNSYKIPENDYPNFLGLLEEVKELREEVRQLKGK